MQAVVFGAVTGLMAGCGAFVFLEVLDLVTRIRRDEPWLLWLLPAVGLGWGLLQWGSRHREPWQRALRGTTLVIEQAQRPDGGVPRRQAPLILVGTWVAHLTGASVGREGVGLQISASMAEHVARWWHLDRQARRLLLVAAVAAGFGAVFAVPWAGALFALEVAGRPRWTLHRVVAATVGGLTGDAVVGWLGHEHTVWAGLAPALGVTTWLRVLAAAILFAGAAWLFVTGVDALRRIARHCGVHPVLRPAVGGAATVVLALLMGRDYLGLSLPLLDDALGGGDPSWTVPVLKAVFTVIALASGFPGGEVTPLFVIGATLGAVVSAPLGMDTSTLAALGMVTLFAAASGAPLASAAMAADLFGAGTGVLAVASCVVAVRLNRRRRIYPAARSHQADSSTRIGNRRGPLI